MVMIFSLIDYMGEMDANNGRTLHGADSGAGLHVIDGTAGHRGGSTDAHGGHTVGGGQITSGQRGLGHGGHSPTLHGLEHVEMHGGHGGTADFNT